MTRKTLLMTLVLMVMALSAVSCVKPAGDDEDEDDAAVELPADDPAEAPSEEPSPAADETADADASLQATVEAELGSAFVLGYYSDDTSNDQCIDLTGDAPVEIDCGDLSEIVDCVLAVLGEQQPLVVLCDVEGDAWGVDLGYEGAYTTADGQRGEFGFSCRAAIFNGEGECTAEIGTEILPSDPIVIQIGRHRGIALGSPGDPGDTFAAAMAELRATTGLEGVVRSTAVLYADTDAAADNPDYAATGFNSFVSLEQHVAVVDGLQATVAAQYVR